MFQLLFGLKIRFVNLHCAREMWRVGKKMRQGPCWNCRLDKSIGFAWGHNKMRIMQIRICTTILYWLEYTEDTSLIFNLTKHVFWNMYHIYTCMLNAYGLCHNSGWFWMTMTFSYGLLHSIKAPGAENRWEDACPCRVQRKGRSMEMSSELRWDKLPGDLWFNTSRL